MRFGVLIIVVLILAALGYGPTMLRGMAWGVGREAAHHVWRHH